ncbi:anti-sigma factor [Neobacillus citreus]|uniref:Anti-sigma-W factor RsiW n=1 Tax=Neobacillus citreus TaxID=2833578 RepID=A0A942Y9X0_9BACI|nr:anti-sigma factor [Neobacillus citreus]MCH6265033.1 anti-sigma factor [Neobacillus citreus]
MENKCENLSLYMINELTPREKDEFEDHLKTCTHCQHELESLQGLWQTLSYEVEEVDVPETLKAEVMNFIFEEKEAPQQDQKVETAKKSLIVQFKLHFKKHFSPLSTAVAVVLVIGLVGLFWNNLQLKETITALETKEADTSQIVSTYILKGQGLASSANGNAYLLQEGGTTNLVIELNNMPRTNNEEVYQVWLLKNGTRQNAGTLKPDQNGNGLITYRLPQALSFDAIGITLEPNPNNTQPQGQKVMGTS